MATRAALKERVQRRLFQTLPTAEMGFAGDPFTLDEWVTQVTDEVARRTWCWFRTITTDLVANRREYCAPDGGTSRIPEIFDMVSAEILDESGNRQPLRLMTATELDERGRGAYLRDDASGQPIIAVFRSPKIELYPSSSYSLDDALIVRGYCLPGNSWPLATDNFPLSRETEDIVVQGVAAQWAAAEAHVPRMAAQYPILQQQYEAGIRRLYGRTMRESA